MKRFKEDKDRKESFPHKKDGPSNPVLIEELKKLECSNPKIIFKHYISDANITNSIIETLKKQQSFVHTTSEYSEEQYSKIETSIQQPVPKEKIEMCDKTELEKDGKLEINITGCVQIRFIFSYVKYEITVYEKETGIIKKVYRRYKEFENLRKALVDKYACVYTPPLPGKIWLGYFDKDLLEKRKKFLQIFLHELQFLVYYFYDSPEIEAFLNPLIDFYSSQEIFKISLIPSLDIDNSLIHLYSYAEIAKKTFVNNLQNIHNKIILKLREPDMSMTDKLTDIVIKNYPRTIIKKNKDSIMEFVNQLKQQKKFVDDVFIVLDDIKKKEKEYQQHESNFNENFVIFQSDYLHNISFGTKQDSYNEVTDIENQIKKITIERPLYVLAKNIADWAQREDNILSSYIDSFNSLNYFAEKEKEIRREMRLIKLTAKNKSKKKEEMVKLTKASYFLNVILILNTIYLHDVRIDRYKYSRFQLYYNAIKFSIAKNKENIANMNQLYHLMISRYNQTQNNY